LNVGLVPGIESRLRAKTFGPEMNDGKPSIAELMILRVPEELLADCTDISDGIGLHLAEASAKKPMGCMTRDVVLRCHTGWVLGEATGVSREHVFLWHWLSQEEQLRFKDPSDVKNERYHEDWYQRRVGGPLGKLEAKGLSMETSVWHLQVAIGSNGRIMSK
jgi:hypothetical protein